MGMILNYEDAIAFREFFLVPGSETLPNLAEVTLFYLIYNIAKRMRIPNGKVDIKQVNSNDTWNGKVVLNNGMYYAEINISFNDRDKKRDMALPITLIPITMQIKDGKPVKESAIGHYSFNSRMHPKDGNGKRWWDVRIGLNAIPHTISLESTNTVEQFYEYASQEIVLFAGMIA